MTQTSRQSRPGPALPSASILPALGKRVYGRDALARKVADRLSDPRCRLLTLTGPGGVGKTTLALLAAEAIPGAAFVPLAAVRDAARIPDAAARACGLPEAADPIGQIAERAAKAPLLLVLDNLEHLNGAGEMIGRMLAASARLTILATSRTRLGLEGEEIERVEPFAGASPAAALATLWANPGVRLYVDRARRVDAAVEKSLVNARAIAKICHRLGGLPLAIELAASRSRVFSPPELLARLDRSLDLLVNRDEEEPDRLRTMRGAINWSYDLLSEGEQALFRRLAVFAGGFTADAAAGIAAGWSPAFGYPACGLTDPSLVDWQAQLGRESPAAIGPWDPPALPPLPIDPVLALETLILHRLVNPVASAADQSRFAMPEPVREFGLELLGETGELAAVEHAFAVQMMFLAEIGGLRLWSRDRLIWINRLKEEIGNFRAVFAWAARQSPAADQIAARTAESLWQFWQTCGYCGEGAQHIERALARHATSPIIRAATLAILGMLRWSQNDPVRAKRALDESLDLAEAHHYEVGEAHALTFMALVNWTNHEYEMMAANARTSMALYFQQQDRIGISISLVILSIIARGMGQYGEALQMLRQAEAHAREIEFLWGLATAQYYLGETFRAKAEAERASGNPSEADEADAARCLREGFVNYQRQDESLGMAGCLSGLAGLAAARGATKRAARLLAAAGKLGEASGAFLPPTEKDNYEALAARVHQTLGDEEFFKAAAVGYAMPLDHALHDAERALEPEEAQAAALSDARTSALFESFTARQREVADLLARGLTDHQIAEAISRSVRTVEGHVLTIRAITGSPNRAALVALLNRPA